MPLESRHSGRPAPLSGVWLESVLGRKRQRQSCWDMSLVTAGDLTVLNSKGCSCKFVIYRKFPFLLMPKSKWTGFYRASRISIWGSKNPQRQNRVLLISLVGTATAKSGQDILVAWLSGKQDLYVCAYKYVTCIWLHITHNIYQMQRYILYIHVFHLYP